MFKCCFLLFSVLIPFLIRLGGVVFDTQTGSYYSPGEGVAEHPVNYRSILHIFVASDAALGFSSVWPFSFADKHILIRNRNLSSRKAAGVFCVSEGLSVQIQL